MSVLADVNPPAGPNSTIRNTRSEIENATTTAPPAAVRDRPDLLARRRREPDLLHTAREELLRWTSPVVRMRRTATCDLEIEGQEIHAGDKVLLFYGAATAIA